MTGKTPGRWLAVGGANLDIKTEPFSRLIFGTSNPGRVRTTAGGVARNVAENLARLGEEVDLFALVGEDADGEWLRQVTAKSGVGTAGMLRLGGQRTGRYIAVHDDSGEMVVAVSDMAIHDAWDEALLRSGLAMLRQADGLFVDANLPPFVMEAMVQEAARQGLAIVADPVSLSKAERWKGLLTHVSLIAPNRDEAAVLTGVDVRDRADVERAAHMLSEHGAKRVMITLGAEGVCVLGPDVGEAVWLPAPFARVRDVTGAGDAFTSGAMFGLFRTESSIEQAAYGLVMAHLALESERSVAEKVNLDWLLQAKEDYLREIGHSS